ncbi:MAG TPA: hypothetical protein VEC93_09380 [Anaerolineae bacterium]|nr:hypothetical protein [Anaerolineae bacterium]
MLKITLYTLFWFLAGYVPAFLLEQFISLPFKPSQFGLLGLLVGLVLLASLTRTEQGRRLFYEGPTGDEDSNPLIGCLPLGGLRLWAVPVFLILAAVATWLVWSGLGGFN